MFLSNAFLVTRAPVHFSSFSPGEYNDVTVTNITPSSISQQSTSSYSPSSESSNTSPASPPPTKQRKPIKQISSQVDDTTYFFPERQDNKGPKKYFKQVC